MIRRLRAQRLAVGCLLLLVLDAGALRAPAAALREGSSARPLAFADAGPRSSGPRQLASPYGGRPDPADAAKPALLAVITRDLPITSRPGGGRVLGSMPSSSVFIHTPTVAWIQSTTADGRYGRVTVPFRGGHVDGWISLAGLKLRSTPITVHVSLSRHLVVVDRLGTEILRFAAANGSRSSPTPPGTYFVTDRVPFDPSGPYGAFAFGISGIQMHLPPGWSLSDQLAIHGTNDPGSIGLSVSAGCLRVSARALLELEPLLRLGTPVIIQP
jgi:hypothetical protein